MKKKNNINKKAFHVEFKNTSQQLAWTLLEQHDLTFLLGPAGTGKTYLSAAYAVSELLHKRKKKIVITRPTVEAGEYLGHLPGTFEEKITPFIMPFYDAIQRLVGPQEFENIKKFIELAPIAYMRGRTFSDSICILDEAQNCTKSQLKLFMTRLGENSKMIINGDASQSDLNISPVPLNSVVDALRSTQGIGLLEFDEKSIVRHPLVAVILERLCSK